MGGEGALGKLVMRTDIYKVFSQSQVLYLDDSIHFYRTL